jgi:hypothetical protein
LPQRHGDTEEDKNLNFEILNLISLFSVPLWLGFVRCSSVSSALASLAKDAVVLLVDGRLRSAAIQLERLVSIIIEGQPGAEDDAAG